MKVVFLWSIIILIISAIFFNILVGGPLIKKTGNCTIILKNIFGCLQIYACIYFVILGLGFLVYLFSNRFLLEKVMIISNIIAVTVCIIFSILLCSIAILYGPF